MFISMKGKLSSCVSKADVALFFAGGRRMSERDMTRVGAEQKPSPVPGPQLLNSKSVPSLHHIGEFLR